MYKFRILDLGFLTVDKMFLMTYLYFRFPVSHLDLLDNLLSF